MDEFVIAAYPQLAEPASVKSLDGRLAIDGYAVGDMALETPDGVAYQIQLTNTGEGIVLSGTVSCAAVTPCARCLKPASLAIEGEVEGYYLLQPAEKLEGFEADEFECIDAEGNFDIAPALQAALVYATPFVVLCKKDCKGLCSTCGADLNEGPCACDTSEADDFDNPFAVLKNLKFDEE